MRFRPVDAALRGANLCGAALAFIIVKAVRFYQLAISPLLGKNCRFSPTCSQYCIQAVQKYGVAKGLLKTAWRILRCNPFCKGGWDPP